MKIPELAFTVTDWSKVEATRHPGETGEAVWRTFTVGACASAQSSTAQATLPIIGAIGATYFMSSRASCAPS